MLRRLGESVCFDPIQAMAMVIVRKTAARQQHSRFNQHFKDVITGLDRADWCLNYGVESDRSS